MQMKLKEVPNLLLLSYAAKANTWLWGKPGIGKTETIMSFVDRMREKVEDFGVWFFYGPTMGPTDIQAAMPDMASKTLMLYNNASLPNAHTDPDKKGVLFIGEAANTDPTTFKLLQKYVNGEDMNGVLRKPEGVLVVCDGNRLQDKSGVQQQGRAMMNRFQHVDVYTDAKDNTEYAERMNWFPTVQVFFKDHPELIDTYERVFEAQVASAKGEEIKVMAEEGKRGIWASMRGWKRVHDMEIAAQGFGVDIPVQAVIGCVGSGPGREYMATRSFMTKLASVEEICANPKKAPVPEKIDELYAQTLVLALKCTTEQLPAVHTYSERLPGDMVAMLVRRMLIRTKNDPDFKLASSKAYIAWMNDKNLSDLYMAK